MSKEIKQIARSTLKHLFLNQRRLRVEQIEVVSVPHFLTGNRAFVTISIRGVLLPVGIIASPPYALFYQQMVPADAQLTTRTLKHLWHNQRR